MGATINAKGWALISEGLSTLEVATAGVDVPQLWTHFKTFFGKVDDDLEETLSHISSASSTFQAAHKCKVRTPVWILLGMTLFILWFTMKSQVTLLFVWSLNFSHTFIKNCAYIGVNPFLFISGIPIGQMPKHKSQGEGKGIYECSWEGCAEASQSRTNICTHMRRDHLKVAIMCNMGDNAIFSAVTYRRRVDQ